LKGWKEKPLTFMWSIKMKEEQRNKRNLKYEKNFMKYLFRGNWERQKEICKSINVVESTEETRRARK
jgi:hypothetical protein